MFSNIMKFVVMLSGTSFPDWEWTTLFLLAVVFPFYGVSSIIG